MYARVVRFTDVDSERIAQVASQIEESDGPPPDVPSIGIRMMVDEAQSTAVVLVLFDTEEDLRKGSETLDAMDAGETPGTRASVDLCEVKVDKDMS
jgi:hypothetical protein